MGEVLVIQVGNDANFIGSHMWNSREVSPENEKSSKLYHMGKQTAYPRCIMIDSPDNMGQLGVVDANTTENVKSIWGGITQVSTNSRPQQSTPTASAADPARQGVRYWSDFLQPELHNKTICELPTWATGDYFDSYHKGVVGNSSNNAITDSYLETIIDQARYFAEGCDHLSTIEIITQHTTGIAGLTTSILQGLREDFGNSICIPIWCSNQRKMDETVLKWEGATLLDSISAMKNRVNILDSSLFYTNSLEYCNSIVPISLAQILSSIYGHSVPNLSSDLQYNTYTSTATAAAALCTTQSYLSTPSSSKYTNTPAQHFHSADPREASSCNTYITDQDHNADMQSAHQWCTQATLRGRLPVCFLEAAFPGILQRNDSNASANTTGYNGLEQYIIDAFHTTSSSSSGNKYSTVNPFTVNLSPVSQNYAYFNTKRGDNSDNISNAMEFPYEKAFTNLISVRGSGSEWLRESLYGQRTKLPYRITGCQLNASPLYLAPSSPFYNASAEDEEVENEGVQGEDEDRDGKQSSSQYGETGQTQTRPSCVELATAVTTSVSVGAYLFQQSALWRAASRLATVSVQLSKAGLDSTECVEVEEALGELTQRYVE